MRDVVAITHRVRSTIWAHQVIVGTDILVIVQNHPFHRANHLFHRANHLFHCVDHLFHRAELGGHLFHRAELVVTI